jgi:hypothetical protein
MFTPQEELGKISQERLAREAQAARIVKAAGASRPGLAQRAVHNAGESFVSLGNWMKLVSKGEPAEDWFEIRFTY